MVNGLIITHGKLGDELARTASLIAGDKGGLRAISNEELSPQALLSELEREIKNADEGDGVIVFADLAGGSCELAGQAVARQRAGARIVCGVNLAMIVAFIQHRGNMQISDLVKKIEERGRGSIRVK